ncbi:MAG: alpha/beta hydrolase [Solirubrobacterales bacterium]
MLAALLAGLAMASWPGSAVASYVKHTVSYDLDSPVSPPGLNRLDLYVPAGLDPGARRPLVVYVHGGGWRRGDKAYRILNKANLFTGSGYLFASVNYRLSPDPIDLTNPDRVLFPDHPHDLGEAVAWLDRNAAGYGGDPTRIVLIGHSAGAHLVSLAGTDPTYLQAYSVSPGRIRGVVSLDTAGFDIVARASSPDAALYYNAFGTPAENALTGAWAKASPIRFADPGDPPFLLITQNRAASGANNRAMAAALGQDSAQSVLQVPLDHEGINEAVGSPTDATGETAAITGFIRRVVAGHPPPPRAQIRKRPPAVIVTARRRVRVSFAFGSSRPGSRFECRIGAVEFSPCRSPRTYTVGPGRHVFGVRAVRRGGGPGRPCGLQGPTPLEPAGLGQLGVRRR